MCILTNDLFCQDALGTSTESAMQKDFEMRDTVQAKEARGQLEEVLWDHTVTKKKSTFQKEMPAFLFPVKFNSIWREKQFFNPLTT